MTDTLQALHKLASQRILLMDGAMGTLAYPVLLFALVFTQVQPLSAAALFAGFIVTQLVVISGLLMRGDTDTDKENTNGS